MFRIATWPSRATALVGALLVLGLWAAASGQAPPANPPAQPPGATPAEPQPAPAPARALLNPDRAADETAILALDDTFVEGYNNADLDAVAATFSADAQLVDERGAATKGRAAIRERFARTLRDSPGATLETELKSLRFLGPDLAVGRGVATLKPAEADAAVESAPYTVIYVKRDREWLQASVEDHTPPPVETESNAERLNDLAWMLGEWINERRRRRGGHEHAVG